MIREFDSLDGLDSFGLWAPHVQLQQGASRRLLSVFAPVDCAKPDRVLRQAGTDQKDCLSKRVVRQNYGKANAGLTKRRAILDRYFVLIGINFNIDPIFQAASRP